MLRLRVRYLLDYKGIANPFNYLVSIGLSPNVSSRLLLGTVKMISIVYMNKICKHVQCTPNDLFEFVPDGETMPDKHPLHSMIREDKPYKMLSELKELSLDQAKEVEEFIAKIKRLPKELS